MRLRRSKIIGTGSYHPPKVLSNFDLEQMVETTNQWIIERTGIHERRIVEKGEGLSDLCERASRSAMKMAGVKPEDLDQIIVGTITPDMPMPASACILQKKLGANRAAAYDLAAGCTGFIYSLAVADQFIRTGCARTILILGADILSNIVNWKDRATCILFGDGAGAAVLQSYEGTGGVMGTRIRSDGQGVDLLKIPMGGSACPATPESLGNGDHCIQMMGSEVFKCAVRSMSEVAQEVLNDFGLDVKDIDLLIPHQANIRIMKAMTRQLGIDPDRVMVTIDKYGNTSSAAIPAALDEAVRRGRVQQGDRILLTAFGAGLTWGASLIQW
ncbi:MAG: ketoacyl-ACP synthase III [Deltaproteobacteria bacterium]|nr:ketoacyl-ACP synthase III [Deltaproteobacteria bacterium]